MEIIIIICVVVAYILPGIIATMRQHHQAGAIFALNLFAGWTLIGWIASLVWAVSAVKEA
jgi:hypothetical protein